MSMMYPKSAPALASWQWHVPPPLPARPGGKRCHLQHLLISKTAVDRCDKMVEEFLGDHDGLQVDQMCSIGRAALFNVQMKTIMDRFVFERQSVFHALTWMNEHPFWGKDGVCGEPVTRLKWYFDHEIPVIPDDYPQFGLIDNAMIVEMVRPFFDGALLDFCDYQDFCKTRGLNIAQGDPREWVDWRVKEQHERVSNPQGFSRSYRHERPYGGGRADVMIKMG